MRPANEIRRYIYRRLPLAGRIHKLNPGIILLLLHDAVGVTWTQCLHVNESHAFILKHVHEWDHELYGLVW